MKPMQDFIARRRSARLLAALLALFAGLANAQETHRLLVERHAVETGVSESSPVLRGAQVRPVPGAAGRLQVVQLPADADLEQTLEALRADPAVRFAEPDIKVRVAHHEPDDAYFQQQWALHGGEGEGHAGGIDWLRARHHREPRREVVVAVLDTGVDYLHPDLTDNLWSSGSCGEHTCPAGSRTVGWNAIADSGQSGAMDDADDSHGTHVAGIIGAVAGNGEGIAGIAPAVRIMPIKFLDGAGEGYVSDAVRAIDYAIDNGADIINLSYGYPGGFSQAEFEALARARAAGVLVVAAAGNRDGANNDLEPYYPASHRLDNIIAVGASDRAGRLAPFSSYGMNSVHLAAPGEMIFSTLRREAGAYGPRSGTSMAVPMVSGVAALVLAAHPELDARRLRERLLLGVDRREALRGRVLSSGILNARGALDVDPRSLPPLPPSRLEVRVVGGRAELSWLDNASSELGYRVERRAGPNEPYEVIAEALPADTTRFADEHADSIHATRDSYRVQAYNESGYSAFSSGARVERASTDETSSSDDLRCFIATAAYGSPLAGQVQLLRDLRDAHLLPYAPGRAVVNVYYTLSPPAARMVERSSLLRWWVRLELGPLLWLLERLDG